MNKKFLIPIGAVLTLAVAFGAYWRFFRIVGPPNAHVRESAFLKEAAEHARYIEKQLKNQLAENNPSDNAEKLKAFIHSIQSDAEVLEAGSAAHMRIGYPVTEDWMEGCQVHIGSCKNMTNLTGTKQSEPGDLTAVTCLNLIRKYTGLCGDSGALSVSFYENKKLAQTITTLPSNSPFRSYEK